MHSSTLLPLLPLLPLTTALQLPRLQPFLAALPVQLSDYIPPTTALPPSNFAAPLNHAQKSPHAGLRKRQTLDLSGSSNSDSDNDSSDDSDVCPRDFTSCANLGAASLCCSPSSRCAPDMAGHVACCPLGAACTGTIGGVLTAGTIDSSGNLVGAGGAGMQETGSSGVGGGGGAVATQSTTTTQGFSSAAGGGNGGLVVASSTLASGDDGDGGDFVMNGGETVATPAAAVRGADIPVIAKAIIRIVDFWI